MKGKIIVYYGEGEGKTSAALGHAIRASNYGKVAVIQFMKKRKTGEGILKNYKNIDFYNFGLKTFFTGKSKKLHKEEARKAFKLAEKLVLSGKYFLVILDEVLYALEFKLIDEEKILNLLKAKNCHIIITGRRASKKILELSDTATEFKKIKHHYDKDRKTIKGIDY